ncbi:VOC family protein [Halobacillus salinus]|uniref:VOC family protein n=1 Tax=Halobacillus salinus TaxID=192814 RepID=A0A4Z0H697_9BACI|nr:VOC family protein [Halobacillus salinus]TGB04921.1 VOC family protein [Halobacillus salinus]
MSYKPQGYSSVSPYLVTHDATAVIHFLKEAFNGQELRRYERDDGSIMHAEVKLDDSVIMIAQSTEGWPGYKAHIHLYVPDSIAVYHKALEAGGQSVQEPVKKDDSDRRGGVSDPAGNTWWISTQVTE